MKSLKLFTVNSVEHFTTVNFKKSTTMKKNIVYKYALEKCYARQSDNT